MLTIQGDLIQLALSGRFDVIVHGCNCMCTMGAGIAKRIRATFPAAYAADCATQPGDRAKLGRITEATVETTVGSLIVVNAYTQFDWRGAGLKVNYAALEQALRLINARYPGKRVGLPRIGAGLAGGDWNRIAALIATSLDAVEATVVEYSPSHG